MLKTKVFYLFLLLWVCLFGLVGCVSAATPAATFDPDNRETEALTLYLRSDTYTTLEVSGYGLDVDYTNTALSVNASSAGVVNVTYGIRVYLVTSDTVSTEITGGVPVAQILLTGNFSGQLSSSWVCPETTVIMGYQALQVEVYVSLNNGGSWSAQASFISPVVMSSKLVSNAWILSLKVNMVQDVNTTSSFTFGDSDNRCTVSGVVIQTPLQSEVQGWRLSRGDYVGFEIGAYTDIIGSAFYVLILLVPTGILYFRYGHVGTIVFFFLLFGGTGGLVWVLVPAWAATVVSGLLILGFSFVVWRVIR
jgi:hypothetical protein